MSRVIVGTNLVPRLLRPGYEAIVGTLVQSKTLEKHQIA